MAGGYATHGEAFIRDNNRDIFWAYGGDMVGQSPKRLKFLKGIVESCPFEEMEPDPVNSDAHNYYALRKGFDLYLIFTRRALPGKHLWIGDWTTPRDGVAYKLNHITTPGTAKKLSEKDRNALREAAGRGLAGARAGKDLTEPDDRVPARRQGRNNAMGGFKYSYFQLTFGQEEAYLYPERSYERLKRLGYDAIEITPPKGRYGLGVSMEKYLETSRKLKQEFRPGGLLRERVLGRGVGPVQPVVQDADRAEYRQPGLPGDHDLHRTTPRSWARPSSRWPSPFTPPSRPRTCRRASPCWWTRCAGCAITRPQRASAWCSRPPTTWRWASSSTPWANHRRIIQRVERGNIGIQLDCFHANFEELGPV